jgi:serine/threonine protein kinase
MQAVAFESFLRPLFEYDPAERPTALQMLQHPFLQPRNPPAGAASKPAGASSVKGQSPSQPWSKSTLFVDSESEAYDSEEAEASLSAVWGVNDEQGAGTGVGKK